MQGHGTAQNGCSIAIAYLMRAQKDVFNFDLRQSFALYGTCDIDEFHDLLNIP